MGASIANIEPNLENPSQFWVQVEKVPQEAGTLGLQLNFDKTDIGVSGAEQPLLASTPIHSRVFSPYPYRTFRAIGPRYFN